MQGARSLQVQIGEFKNRARNQSTVRAIYGVDETYALDNSGKAYRSIFFLVTVPHYTAQRVRADENIRLGSMTAEILALLDW